VSGGNNVADLRASSEAAEPKSSFLASWCQLRFIPPSVTRELGREIC
jgi:hypothetical protein